MSLNVGKTRLLMKRSTTTGVVPTVAPSTDWTDGTWDLETDIYIGELFVNTADSRIWFRDDYGIHEILFTGSNPTFLSLTDTPAGYAGSSLYGVRVNAAETALEFYEITQDYAVALDTDLTVGYPMSSAFFETLGSPASLIPIERINDGGTGLTDLWSGDYLTTNIATLVAAAMGVAGTEGFIQICNEVGSPVVKELGVGTTGKYDATLNAWNFEIGRAHV